MVVAAAEEVPRAFRTNEPKVDWIYVFNVLLRDAFDGVANGERGELLQVLLFPGAALRLNFAELFQSLLEAAGQALFVEREGFKGVRGFADGFGEGEGGVSFGVAG